MEMGEAVGFDVGHCGVCPYQGVIYYLGCVNGVKVEEDGREPEQMTDGRESYRRLS